MSAAPSYERLRADGIARAQDLSGAVWTDFNLHDPGVTLLEQTCFALTELGYRAGFPAQDLLTDVQGELVLRDLGLHAARDVLPTRPVTQTDIALALAQHCPDAQRVLVYPGGVHNGADRRGLYDLHVVPAHGGDPVRRDRDALAQVRAAYHRIRNLCEDLGGITLAQPVPCRLVAEIEVRRRATPERVAALIYDRCYRLMIDGTLVQPAGTVTRQDVFDHPERVFGKDGGSRDGASSLAVFFHALSELAEVESVTALRFEVAASGGDPFGQPLPHGHYRLLEFPVVPQAVGLRMSSRGLAIAFDVDGMNKELLRLRSEDRARRLTILDAAEWDRPPQGRRRGFAHARIGNGLPAAYGVGQDLPSFGLGQPDRLAAMQLRAFLALTDTPVANASADLAGLPVLFAADAGTGHSYCQTPFDFGDVTDLGLADTQALAAAVGDLDPWRDRKGRLLTYLLGLYSEAFTQNSLQLLDVYRTGTERQDRVLENRAGFLQEIAGLARDRSAGADFPAGQRSDAVGFGRKLALLLGLRGATGTPPAAALAGAGLRLYTDPDADAAWRVEPGDLITPDDPLAAMVLVGTDIPELPPADLLARSDALSGGTVSAETFRRAACVDSYVLARERRAPAGWSVLLVPDDITDGPGGAQAPVLRCGRFASHRAATLHANQLARLFTALNTASEAVWIVEDVLLRGSAGGYAPLCLTVVFAGWSARTRTAAFRALAAETVSLLCPAHLHHRLVWLDHDRCATFEGLHHAWSAALRDRTDQTGADEPQGGAERAAAADTSQADQACAALRAFLCDGSGQ